MSHVCTLVKVTVLDKAQTKLSLTCLPFGEPQLIRRVVLLERPGQIGRLSGALAQAIIGATK